MSYYPETCLGRLRLPESGIADSEFCYRALSSGIRVQAKRARFAEDVKDAWIALRYEHPILACHIHEGRIVYQTADEPELKDWLAETLIVHDSKVAARELYGMTPRPFNRVICHVLLDSQEILVQSTHAHVDGLGVVTLFDNLLRMLGRPRKVVFGDEAKNLLPPLSTIAQIPSPTPQQQARWDSSLNAWLSNHPTLRLAATNTNEPPGRSQVQSLTFSATSTALIINAVRALNLTVTHAAQAAIALAAHTHGKNNPGHSTFSTFAIYNARDYCSGAGYGPSALVGPHFTAALATFQLGSFLATARSVRDVFVSERADGYALTMLPVFTQAVLQTMATPQATPPSTPLFSSFGNLDGRLQRTYDRDTDGEIELLDFWCTLDEVTPDVYIGMWTFGGRLTLQVGYNEVFHERGSIERFLGLVREQLAGGLGVELETEE